MSCLVRCIHCRRWQIATSASASPSSPCVVVTRPRLGALAHALYVGPWGGEEGCLLYTSDAADDM
eukprot:13572884-Alexandrium_andersonii.AAC.1